MLWWYMLNAKQLMLFANQLANIKALTEITSDSTCHLDGTSSFLVL